jgi:hypothetical protein
MEIVIVFTRKYYGPIIEEFIKYLKSSRQEHWKALVNLYLQGDALIWGNSLMALSNEEFEKLFLDRCSHVGKRDIESIKGLFSYGNSMLQVHGCIHKENVIVSINPSCQQNFINVQLVNILQVPTKNVQST